MRVGILAIQHESNTFLPSPTTIESFRQGHLISGDAVRAAYQNAHHEVGGFFAGLESAAIQPVPLLAAWAMPSGVITAEAGAHLVARMDQALAAAGRLDGLLVAPHGAAVCESQPDFDGHWLSLVRKRIGPGVPIIGTLDPHANVSLQMVEACDALVAYRTNPHLDQRERGLEAAALMVRTLAGEIRPVLSAAMPPVAINIERQNTEASPCRDLRRMADAMLDRPQVLSVSVLLGFPYADVAEMGSGVLVVTDSDAELGRRCADDLADQLWQRRDEFVGHLTAIDKAIARARQIPGTIGLLDMGDNVGGGSPGDGTELFAAAVTGGLQPALAILCDPEAVARAIALGPGGRFRGTLGGRVDPAMGESLAIEGTVESVHDGRFREDQPRHGGQSTYDMGPTAVVRAEGGDSIVVTSRRVAPFSLGQLTSCGVDPRAFRAIVIKGVHAPVAAYSPVCAELIRVDTPGVTSANLARFDYRHRRRPMFPWEPETTWQPAS